MLAFTCVYTRISLSLNVYLVMFTLNYMYNKIISCIQYLTSKKHTNLLDEEFICILLIFLDRV